MDFSEIGVKSRKTGLTAKENVRRDENDMEDVDDFFRDEPSVNESSNNPDPNKSNANGRIIFPRSADTDSLTRNRIRNSPLRSPLQSRVGRIRPNPQLSSNNDVPTNDDLFTDARENPLDDDNNNNNNSNNNYNNSNGKDDYSDSAENMEIDDESKGTIKVINNQQMNGHHDENLDYDDYGYDVSMQEDLDKVPINQVSLVGSQSTPLLSKKTGQKLFVSSDDDTMMRSSPSKELQKEQRRRELERNVSIRRSPNRRLTNSRITSPKIYDTSPLASTKLHSPLQPRTKSSKSIASITKKLATSRPSKKVGTTKSRQRTPSPFNEEDDESEEDQVSSSDPASEYNDQEVDDLSDDDDDHSSSQNRDNDDQEDESSETFSDKVEYSTKKLKTRVLSDSDDELSDKLPARSRGRSKARTVASSRIPSPSSRTHVIKAESLKKQQSRASSVNPESRPIRQSTRIKLPPLAFWRNEKAVYKKGRGSVVPELQEVITVDEVITPLKSRAPSRAPSRVQSRASSRPPQARKAPLSRKRSLKAPIEDILEEESETEQDEDEAAAKRGLIKGSEWMIKKGFLKINTYDGHGDEQMVSRTIAWAPGTENFSTSVSTATDQFKLAILFDKNREFIASGMMLIPPGGVKSLKSTDDTYFVFFCVRGILEVTLSGSNFIISKGCSLEVPMGNFYQFVNKGKKNATLFFVQTRGHSVVDDDDDDDDSMER